MDLTSVQTVLKGSPEESLKILTNFNTHNEKSRDFNEIDLKTKLQLWDAIFNQLSKSSSVEQPSEVTIRTCLNTLRILSREKKTLETAMNDQRVLTLLELSDLKLPVESQKSFKLVEGLKVIFNMVFQSPTLQIMFISNRILDGLIQRIQDFTNTTSSINPEDKYSIEYQYFVLRILFLITALCKDTAPSKVRNLHNGLEVLNKYLESLTLEQKSDGGFADMTADIICEALKIFYNLIHNITQSEKTKDLDNDDLEQLNLLMKLTRSFLICEENNKTDNKKHLEIKQHSIDLLSAIPPPCLIEVIPPVINPEIKYQYDGLDMSAVDSVVNFLDNKLDEVKKGNPQENLAPPLGALHNMVSGNRFIRKYLKQRILPPLSREDVINLPEVGSTIRNKLCSLLTSPVTHITELVADLLFILCKESVKKLIKYTGYGNAAGLLANKGLMLGGKAPPGKYSESEEESDTEDYKEVEHLINQVEGRIQLERPNPMEGMTDEQKEVEAMKLISVIDKMERDSAIIKPCRIGPDGRPVPIQHVLQLQEALENPMKSLRRNEDSDSDSD